jgi:hypothetical protein
VKLISCFSYVQGKNNAIEIVKDLNSLKDNNSKPFKMMFVGNDTYLIRGLVNKKDWVNLNLSTDFMRI